LNKAAIEVYNNENDPDTEIRQVKYLDTIVNQNHRFIKRITKFMLGFIEFHSASVTLGGIELVRIIRKGRV